jgi:CTP synthase
LHAAAHYGCRAIIDWVDAEELSGATQPNNWRAADGIIVPGGFASAGIEGKSMAARYCSHPPRNPICACAWACK